MFTLREASEADWPSIWRMFQEVTAAGDVFAYDETTTEAIARKLWFDSPACAFVAVNGEEVVGTYYIRPNFPGRGAHIANAGYMVSVAARGQGLATTMCLHSLESAKAQGYRAMQFNYVVSTNVAALTAWQRCGFTVIGRIPAAFQHPREGFVDALIMFRALS